MAAHGGAPWSRWPSAPTGAPSAQTTSHRGDGSLLRKKALLGSVTVLVLLVAATAALAATFTGTDGPDVINGTPMADTINALGGDDTVNGLGGNDTIDGGSDDDTLNGDGACPAGSPTTGPYSCIPGSP